MSIPEDFFDLSTWAVTEELASLAGVKCPYCNELLPKSVCVVTAFAKCPLCFRIFRWRTMVVPGGVAHCTRKQGGDS